MTVDGYLRSLVQGLDLQDNVVERAALSPIDVELDPLDLTAEVNATSLSDTDFHMRLDYASSTIFYAVLGVFAGGGYSEQVGDVRASRGGYTITMADRARFKAMGDDLRKKWGFDVVEDAASSEIYDASYISYEYGNN